MTTLGSPGFNSEIPTTETFWNIYFYSITKLIKRKSAIAQWTDQLDENHAEYIQKLMQDTTKAKEGKEIKQIKSDKVDIVDSLFQFLVTRICDNISLLFQ